MTRPSYGRTQAHQPAPSWLVTAEDVVERLALGRVGADAEHQGGAVVEQAHESGTVRDDDSVGQQIHGALSGQSTLGHVHARQPSQKRHVGGAAPPPGGAGPQRVVGGPSPVGPARCSPLGNANE